MRKCVFSKLCICLFDGNDNTSKEVLGMLFQLFSVVAAKENAFARMKSTPCTRRPVESQINMLNSCSSICQESSAILQDEFLNENAVLLVLEKYSRVGKTSAS